MMIFDIDLNCLREGSPSSLDGELSTLFPRVRDRGRQNVDKREVGDTNEFLARGLHNRHHHNEVLTAPPHNLP